MNGSLATFMRTFQEATRAARARTACDWIGTTLQQGKTAVVLVIYRTSGSSIVLELTSPMEHAQALAFLSTVDRATIRHCVKQELTRLELRLKTGTSPRLTHDADLLSHHLTNTIPE